MSIGIYMRAVSQKMIQLTKMSLKIQYLKLNSQVPLANDFSFNSLWLGITNNKKWFMLWKYFVFVAVWSHYYTVDFLQTTPIRHQGPLYWHELTLIPAGISNYIPYKVCGKITYPFPNFSSCIDEVWEWIVNFISHIIIDVITYPCWD